MDGELMDRYRRRLCIERFEGAILERPLCERGAGHGGPHTARLSTGRPLRWSSPGYGAPMPGQEADE